MISVYNELIYSPKNIYKLSVFNIMCIKKIPTKSIARKIMEKEEIK